MIIYHLISLLVFAYICFNVFYILLFAIVGAFRKQPAYRDCPVKKKIAILIPAYKEDSVIIETARQAVSHHYPKDSFKVFVIADQLQEKTVRTLSQLPLHLIPVSFSKSTKARSIKYALQQIPDGYYDILMILDADNIMGEGCLEKVNAAFQQGFSLVQLHRTAKNRNTPTAILDAASEEINNHIFRQGHRALGISSALIGSGMAFDYFAFKKLMLETDIENNPGEDREIYLEMLKNGKVCEYIDNALVYDEKVQSGKVLEKQRTRWLSAQLQYAGRFWLKEPFKTLSSNIHYIDYALQTLLLPRVMLLMSTLALLVLNIVTGFITGTGIFPGLILWAALFGGCVLALLISVYRHLSFREITQALLSLPKTFYSFSKAFLKSRPDQQEFIHTPKDFSNARQSS